VNKTILQLIFTICFYPFTIFSAKISILPPIFIANFWELRGTISRTVWTKLVGVQFPSLAWFYFMISLVKIEVFGQVLKPYARERIPAGYPYGACEKFLFPQAGLR
jgi:hypothetical protein